MTTPTTPGPRVTSPVRLVGTLGGFGALAGLLIVVVFAATEPRIRANKAAALAAAIGQVLGEPERYDTLYVTDEGLVTAPPPGVAPDEADAVYLGWRAERPIGFAVLAEGPGFQDNIRLIFGFDAESSRLLGMAVLESKETPGLGDKIIKDSSFAAQFSVAVAPLQGVKETRASGGSNEIVFITGATISSRAVVRAINATLARLGPLLADYRPGA